MTFPNRANYVPGQQQRDPKSIVEKPSVMVSKATIGVKKPLLNRIVTDGIRQELNSMLSSLSPDHSGQASPLPMPTDEESVLDVKNARKRLLEDPTFQRNESFQQLLMFANNPNAPGFQPAPIDPLALLIERLPSSSHGFGGGNDTISTGERSRAQYMQAVAMQKMSDAAEQVGDAAVQAQYTRTAHNLCEWGQRTVQLHRQQEEMQSSETEEVSPLSLSQVSPYAMELAVRNNTPKKRSSLSKKSKKLMQDWFEHNLHHPYPTEEEKEWLAREGGITLEQVNNWFINTRGRKWKPMLNRLMAEKQAGQCSLYDKMVKKIEEPYHTL
ncbi:Homeobox protein 4 [Phytophthora citrophthora]|uniref:Homeobox protein 4 n=1 Tax=Phytophthora citrophthora TaxID=4793 RepID=A0AAD9GEF3_9STRA|nr:Homeobox protein 4 [Phytophthora citrophthora]